MHIPWFFSGSSPSGSAKPPDHRACSRRRWQLSDSARLDLSSSKCYTTVRTTATWSSERATGRRSIGSTERTHMADEDTLVARVQRLEDLAAIERLFLDYRRHLDARDMYAYSRLFCED